MENFVVRHSTWVGEGDEMLLTVAMVVFFSSIILFFSDEFGRFFKKIFAIPGVTLFVPLLLASAFIVHFEAWILWGLLYIKFLMHVLINFLASLLPFAQSARIAAIIIVYFFTAGSLWTYYLWHNKRYAKPYTSSWLAFLTLWSFIVILYLVNFDY